MPTNPLLASRPEKGVGHLATHWPGKTEGTSCVPVFSSLGYAITPA